MSMIGYLKRISSADLQRVRDKPAGLRKLMRGGYDMKAAIRDRLSGKASPRRGAMEAAMARSKQISEEIRNSGREPGPATPDEIKRIMEPLRTAGAFGDEEDVLNLEKSWHTLHYLLAGSAEPVAPPPGNAILGGTDIGTDLGYGPARYLLPDQVRQTAQALAKLSVEDLDQRFDLKTMRADKVYACRDDGDRELALDYFRQLQRFYAEAASSGSAMLLYIK
jgi:Domain of unknown function (DUF1877)